MYRATIAALSAGVLFTAHAASPARPDARRLQTGRFTYRDSDHGTDVGQSRITIRALADAGRYDFSADISGSMSQRWESVATTAFEPLSATLTFGPAAGGTPAFALAYRSGRVTGFAVARHGADSGARRAIDAPVPASTVDQRIDWATVMASDLATGRQFEFTVYDPGTGVSRVDARVGPLERVQVPAGSFDAYRVTYRIEKASGTEQYVVLASRDIPRLMVREEFPDGSVTDLVAVQTTGDSTWQDYDAAADSAYTAHDYARLRAALTHELPMLSGHPAVVYRLGVANARLGAPDSALLWLGTFAAMGLVHDVAADSNLASLRGRPAFDTLARRIADNARPVTHASRAFALADPDLLSEDIAYDPATRTFYVSSVHEGKIIAVGPRQPAVDFARAPAGWGVLALAVDTARRLLWATATAVPQADGYRAADSGRSAVLVYDLRTRALLRRLDAPPDRRPHALGDLTLDRSGTAYVSDGLDGGVYRVRGRAATLEPLVSRGTFASPQTPALSPDERRLFVPDYVRGIGIVDLGTGAVSWLAHPPTVAVNGIDGMYRVGRTLLAIQNGTVPERVIALRLDPTLSQVDSAVVLDASWPGLGDPTHGVVVGADFYFIANSGWDRWRDDGSRVAGAVATAPVIMLTRSVAAP